MKSLYTTRAAARRMAIVFVCAFQLITSLSADNYYWVNGSGDWSDFAGHWAKIPNPTLPAHYHANVPTADDDVFFGDTNAGAAYTVNVDAGSTVPKCRNMDWTGVVAGTVWGGGGGRMDIYGSLTLNANMSMTFNNEIHFISNDVATKSIYTTDVHIPGIVYFEGSDGGWQFMDDFYVVDAIHHTGGLLETMGRTVTVFQNYFYGNVAPGSSGQLNLGNSEVIFSNGGGQFKYDSGQFDAGTSHIKLYGNAGSLNGGAYYAGYPPSHFYNVSFYGNFGQINGGFGGDHIDGTLTFYQRGAIYSYNGNVPILNNVVLLGDCYIHDAQSYNHLTLTAGKTYYVQNYQGSNGTDQTILPGGTLTALGAGTCSQFITIKSWEYGTHFNFVNNSGVTQTVHCAILEDCHATGSDPLEVIDGVNLGNNTGWIFTAPNPGLDLYWIGGAGDWNDPAHWSETDGGPAGTCIPNGGSNVFFTANSGFDVNPGSVVLGPDNYCKNMDWTGVTGSPILQGVSYPNLYIYGSLTFADASQMSVHEWIGIFTRFRSPNAETITAAGHNVGWIVIFEGSGEWTFLDDFSASIHVYHSNGTIFTEGHTVNLQGRWFGNANYATGAAPSNSAELWLGNPMGNSSTVNLGGGFHGSYHENKFHALQSTIVLYGQDADLISSPHSFWEVKFLQNGILDAAGCHFQHVTMEKNGRFARNHFFHSLTLTGSYEYRLYPNTVQTISASGALNVVSANCEGMAYLHAASYELYLSSPEATAKIAKEMGALHLSQVILDNVFPDMSTGASYSASNSVGIQPLVVAEWNLTNPSPRSLYWVNGAGDWHDSNHWSAISGGIGGECPPTPLDDIFFDGSSGLGIGDMVSISQYWSFCKSMDWMGGSGVLKNTIPPTAYSIEPGIQVFGNIRFSNTMVNDFDGLVMLRANQPSTITSAENAFKGSLFFWEPLGDWSLQDGLTVDVVAAHEFGVLRSNDHPIDIGYQWNTNYYFNPTIYPELFLGSTTLTMKGTSPYGATYLLFGYATGKFHESGSHILFDGNVPCFLNSPTASQELNIVTFKAANATIWEATIKNKLTFEKSGLIQGNGYIHDAEFHDDITFSGSRSYHSMKFAPGKRYTFQSGTTQTLVPHAGVEGQFIAQGLPGQYIEMKSSNPSVPAIIHKDDYDGTSTCTKYLFLTGMTHTGTEDIYVPTPGGDVFNNAGWQFFPCNPCPATIPVLDVVNSITTGCPPGTAKLVLAGLKPDEWANWYTDPAATTDLVYSGGTPGPAGNMFQPAISGPVTYYARVYSDGGLCESTVVLAVDITITSPPAMFNMTGGGLVCSGSNGTPVGLDGSATGVTYQLQLDGLDAGSPVAGTGAALDFGLQTAAGTYTVVANTDGTSCPVVMTGSAIVISDPNAAPAVAAGSNSPVYAENVPLQLTESGGAAVSWDWSGPNGFASADQNPMIANPAAANSGTYTVVVTGANGCTNMAGTAVLVSILSITCPGDVLITLGSGECGAVVNNILPMITGGAGGNSVLVTSGFPSGSEFPIGTTTTCYEVTDAQNNTATCCFDVTVEEFPNPIASLTCNDLVPISLALPDCQFDIPVDTILEGGPYRCFDHYIVEIDNLPPFGNGPWVPAIVGVADIGQTYTIRVTDPDTGNKCWGMVHVQDVLPPQMQCSYIMVDCGPPPIVPPAVSDCQTYTLSYTDMVVLNTPPTTPYQINTRTWTATDASGNTTLCTQTITVQYGQPDATITTSATAQVCPGTTGLTASVPDAGPGATYTWTILNGTITDGQGTNNITYNVDGIGQTVLSVTVVGAGGCSAAGCNNTFIQSLGNMGGSQPNIFPHPNGDFFATGLRNDSMVIIRFDPSGTPLWANAFRLGTNTLLIRDMMVDASGDLIGVAYYETGFASQAKSTVFRYHIATNSFVWVQHISDVLFTNIHDFDANNCLLTGTGNVGYTQLAQIDKSTGAVSTYALQGEGGDYYSVLQNGHLYGACRRYYTASTDLRASVFSHNAATGAFEWQNSLISEGNASGGSNFTRMYPEKPALDNDSLVVLASGDLVGFDLYLDGPIELVAAKTDLVGNLGWTKQYLVSGYDRPVAARIANTADGYYIVANMYLPGLNNFGFGVLIKTDKQGNVQWAKRLGISGKNIVKNIMERNGFLHLVMASDSYAPNELLLLKLDLQGNSNAACDFIQPITVTVNHLLKVQNARPYTVSNRTNTLTPLVETPNPTPFSNVSRCSTPCSNSLVVNVALPDAGNIAGPVTLCSGSGFQYTSSGLAGGLWGSDDPGVAYVDAGTGDVFALAPGFCTITYTVTENGCTNTAYFFLEVLSSPYVEAVSNSPVCAGGDAVLEEIGGEAVAWTWYDPNGFPVSNAQTFIIPNVSPADQGLYVVVGQAANGCVGYAQTPVFLSGPASAGTISGSATVCQGKNTPLSIIGTPGGMWSSSNPAVATVNSVSGVVIGVAPGMVVITYTVSANGCTETAIFNMEVKPRPAVAITGDQIICENETLILTETGGDAVSWVWSNGLGFVTSDQTLTFYNPLYAQFGGFANVSVTDANGCTNSLTVDAGAQPLPAVLATSNAPICPGSGNLELFESGGAQGVFWAWSGPGGFQSGSQNPVIPNPTPANSGDYTVVVTDWTGCMNSQTIQVAITYPEPIPVLVAMPDLITCSTTPVYATTALDPCNINTVIYGTPSGPATLIPNSSPPAYLFSPGMYVVTWTYNNNGVIVTQPQLITIHAQPNVTCPSNSTTCLAAGSIVLSGGAPTGGSYSGPGVNAGVFDPAAAGVGQHSHRRLGQYRHLLAPDHAGGQHRADVHLRAGQRNRAVQQRAEPRHADRYGQLRRSGDDDLQRTDQDQRRLHGLVHTGTPVDSFGCLRQHPYGYAAHQRD
jgi:hypothetical protein